MGDFSMTCSISGLGIPGGTPVRCLLLTASPYKNDDPRRAWILRTPPLRAIYNSYGSIEKVHKEDRFIADLWLRGFREDLIEKGLGDNSVHDVPTAKDMTFEELLDAVRAGRLEVRRDVEHFWQRPRKGADILGIGAALDGALEKRRAAVPSLRTIEGVLSQDTALIERFSVPVSRGADEDRFVVDEPVPSLVRVRFGRYQRGKEVLDALGAAKAAIERAGFVGVVAAGSGRYANDAELLVLSAPNTAEHAWGPQWDMAAGQHADPAKRLTVAMAMVREDVWQALAHYPRSERVALDCTNCGQEAWYHEKDRRCPGKSVNGKPFKKHLKGARYAHGSALPDSVEHVVVPFNYGETLWYDLAAYKAGTRVTWEAVLEHFAERAAPAAAKKSTKLAKEAADPIVDRWLRDIDAARKKERDRIAKLPPEERAKLEADREAQVTAWEAEERDRRENPCFGDFLINDYVVRDPRRPGAWLFRDTVPGVIGVSEHLSMCLADKRDVPLSVLDAIAELSAVSHAIGGVGVTWKPSTSTGPQYPEWDEHLRFAQTVLSIAQSESLRYRSDMDASNNEDPALNTCATLAQVQAHVRMKTR